MRAVIQHAGTDIEEDEEKGGHVHREPDDIEQGKAPVPQTTALFRKCLQQTIQH